MVMMQCDPNDFWNKWHDNPKSAHSLSGLNSERVNGKYAYKTLATLLRHFNFEKLQQSTLLDYGCGNGRLARLLAPHVGAIICADVSSKFLKSAQHEMREHKNIEYLLVQAGKRLDLKKGSIDLSYSYAAINYTSKKIFWNSMDEIDRVSKAFCIQISTPNENVDEGETDQNPSLTLENIKGYRPKLMTLKERYSADNYIAEYLEPDTRGKELFFYKTSFSNSTLYQKIGPQVIGHSDEERAPDNVLGTIKLLRSRLASAVLRRTNHTLLSLLNGRKFKTF